MRGMRTRLALAVSALAVSGAVAGTVLSAGPASAVTATTPPVVLINYCGNHGIVKPSTEDLPGCMPSNEYLAGLTWTSWQSVAYGNGQFRVNNCTPTCATGHYVNYPILTVLWRAVPWPNHAGHSFFSRLTVIFTSAVHPAGPAAQTIRLPAAG